MGFRYTSYSYNGSQERILNIGKTGKKFLFIPALFVENNRLRALTVAVMRQVALSGYHCLLPDLPGTLESRVALENQSLADWEAALSTALGDDPVHIVAMRGGCLLGCSLNVASRWHFAPLTGEKLMRELFRARQATLKEQGLTKMLAEIEADCATGVVELAGERLSPALSTDLKAAQPIKAAKTRTLRLGSDPAEADRHIDGPALWRRSEPESDEALAALLAADIVDWINP